MFGKNLKRKLNSNKGASLMTALLFFVMCATIGSIILAAATASTGRLANLVKKDQSYFATKSASDFLRDTLCPTNSDKRQIVLKIEIQDAEGVSSTKNVQILTDGGTYVDFADNQEILAQHILYMTLRDNFNIFDVKYMNPTYRKSTVSVINTDPERTKKVEYFQTVRLNITVNGDDNEPLNVNGNVYMNKDLDLFVILKPQIESEKDQNILNLWFYSTKKLEEAESITEDGKKNLTYIYTISWQNPVASKGDVPVEHVISTG